MLGLKGRHLLSLQDYNKSELMLIFETTRGLERIAAKGKTFRPMRGKVLGMVFLKNSTRTRVSFETAIYQLGGHGICLRGEELHLARGETMGDTARVLSAYLDAIMVRTHNHWELEEMTSQVRIPVINGLTDKYHPCQALADFYTLLVKKGRLEGLKLAYVGDGNNNVTHSLLLGAAKLGVNIHIATPRGYEPDSEVMALAQNTARISGSTVKLGTDPAGAVADADAVYTDVWVSMGREAEGKERLRDLAAYQVNSSLLSLAKPDVIFLHCLPANRGQEVTDAVLDGPNSAVFVQAYNRLPVQKALLGLLLRGEDLLEEMNSILNQEILSPPRG